MARFSTFLLVMTLFLVATPARADISVLPTSIFSQSGVSGASGALGPSDGTAAIISDGGALVVKFQDWINGNVVEL